jgi:hypothetical protein
VAGVYDNAIVHNVVANNGLKGQGAGVLFANATAGTASYNNLVAGNFIAGNGLSGVTMHAHAAAGPVRGPERQQDHRKQDRHQQPERGHARLTRLA